MERTHSRLSWPTLSALAGRLRPVTDLGARECGDASGSPPQLGFRLASNWRVRNSAGVSAVMGDWWFGLIAGFGVCLILWWVADRHRRR
jgi:hypothetical protein